MREKLMNFIIKYEGKFFNPSVMLSIIKIFCDNCISFFLKKKNVDFKNLNRKINENYIAALVKVENVEYEIFFL